MIAQLLKKKFFVQELIIEGYSSKTVKMYMLYCEEMLYHIGKPVESLEKKDIVGYLAHKKEAGCSNATLSLVHASMEYMFKRHLKMNVLEDIKIAKKAKTLPKVLTKDEIRALFESTHFGRNRLMLQFMYGSGCRVSEVVSLKVEDLNMKEKTATIRGGKGNKDRFIILSKEWVHGVKKYLDRKKVKSEFVFSKKTNGKNLTTDTVQRIVRKSAKKAGINKHVTPHCLRHCIEASSRVFTGQGIRSAQKLFGTVDANSVHSFNWVKDETIVSPLIGKEEQKQNGLLEIQAGGYWIKCTPEHRFFAGSVNGLAEIQAKDIQIGDFVLGAKKIQIEGTKVASNNWWRFVGYVTGDGTVSKSRHEVLINDKSFSNLEFYQHIAEAELGKKPFITALNSGDSYVLTHYSQALVRQLDTIGLAVHAPWKRVPSELFSATNEEICHFLAGYYDADGNEGVPRFFSASKEMLKDVQSLFLRLGINTHLLERNRKVKLPQGKWIQHRIFELLILRQPDQLLFKALIPTRKKIRLENPTRGERIPACKILSKLYPKLLSKKGLIYRIQTKRNIKYLKRYCKAIVPVRETLEKILLEAEKFEDLKEETLALRSLMGENFKWMKVTKITPIEGTHKVYDFTIAGTENFIADGFVVHNSYATHLLEAGTNIRYIQALLGHSSLNTTQIYTNVASEQLKKVVSPLDKL